jgi:predicted nucleotidyltransferase
MAMMKIPADFKEFLKLLNVNNVEYLLIGGYAVGYYGYPRPTGDMDIWIKISPENADKTIKSLNEFGFSSPDLTKGLLLKEKQIVRMGIPPFRLEVSNYIDGVDFDECFSEREVVDLDGVQTNLISLRHLKINKKASGRYKDLNDLENLP